MEDALFIIYFIVTIRTTVKFIPSTLPPITSGFTYSWQKWATSKPFTAAPVSTGSPRQVSF